ncbi:MAG: methyltransferase domain-containing protein [Candidatus Eisenbacteria bacterium]|nr:methyltransferase domain-containing protein [Candidatus Eisenbacteria bacterium]
MMGADPRPGGLMETGFYDQYGERWLSSRRDELERLATEYKVSTLYSLLGELAPARIIDFGCGLGDALHLVAERLSVPEAVGIDISGSMIEEARRRHPEHTFVRGGIDELRSRSADLILFFDVLEHVEDVPSLLKVARGCAPYIAMKVPLELTVYTRLLTLLRMKREGSRHFATEGHLYEFAEKDIDYIVARSGLRKIAGLVTVPPRQVLFHPFLFEELHAMGGITGTVRGAGHALLGRLPCGISRRVAAFLTGSDYFLVCERA